VERLTLKVLAGVGAELALTSKLQQVISCSNSRPAFSGDLDAEILRAGEIENTYEVWKHAKKPALRNSK